ncbi:hypothetical protein HKCCE2091_12835 [Rhodobacterales bacterium HKCCE2091]|nr:hypothetical protein [Rhodobacterales bacterium HKCCE2091]
MTERRGGAVPDACELLSAAGTELSHTAALLRRAEEAIFTALSDPDRGAFEMADVQLLDLAIQTLDDLSPFLTALSSGLIDTQTIDTDQLLDSLRLAGLRARLTRVSSAVATATKGSIEMF